MYFHCYNDSPPPFSPPISKVLDLLPECQVSGDNIKDMLGRIAGDNKLNNKGLVTNYDEGGLQNGREGHVKFYPYEKTGHNRF